MRATDEQGSQTEAYSQNGGMFILWSLFSASFSTRPVCYLEGILPFGGLSVTIHVLIWYTDKFPFGNS